MKLRSIVSLMVSVATLCFAHFAWADVSCYIAPNGNDFWSGGFAQPTANGRDGPLASLKGAREAIRRYRLSKPAPQPIHVVIASGTYFLTQPFTLEMQDSGSSGAPIIYEAADPAHPPVFTGGRTLPHFAVMGDNIWSLSIPEVKANLWWFEQLWVDGKRATRARSPDQNYFHMLSPVFNGPDPVTGRPVVLAQRAIRARPAEAAALAKLSRAELSDVVAVIFHSWDISRAPVASFDAKNSIIYLNAPVHRSMELEYSATRYYLENFHSALTQPGEWFLDRNGTLFYKPLPGQKPTDAEVVAPVASDFVRVLGNSRQGRFVRNITFRNLRFEHEQWNLPKQGQGDGQAATSMPSALTIDGGQSITIDRCEVAHIPGYGIWFRDGCNDCAVTHCYLHDLGAGGIRIGDTNTPDASNLSSHITIDNNILRDGGLIAPDAVAILLTHSAGDNITHNEIDGFRYTGISAGWVWGYGNSLSTNNHIDFNRIHDIGMGVMSDLGGIYTLGRSTGGTVSGNVIYDISAYSDMGWGIYLDEGTSDLTVENNLVYRTKGGAFHQHYGENNLIRNNIFLDGELRQLDRSRVDGHHAFTFEKNIVAGSNPHFLAGQWKDDQFTMRDNLYWSTGKADFDGKSFEEWKQAGKDAGSIFADPLFENARAEDYAVRRDSPAWKLGFKSFQYAQAGVGGDEEWKKLASDVHYPVKKIEDALPPPPLILAEDFEASAVGDAPLATMLGIENVGTIKVTREAAASGRQSLCITDAPGQRNPWDPHFYYLPHHRQGVSTLSFAFRYEPGAVVFHEWRDNRWDGYHAGPSININNGHLRAGNQDLMDLPADQWITIKIACGMGKASTGKYNVAVTVGNAAPRVFSAIPYINPEFNSTEWLGFCALNNDKAVWYLDDISLTSTDQ